MASPSLTRAYSAGRKDQRDGFSRDPSRDFDAFAQSGMTWFNWVADYDRGYSQALAEWRPAYESSWPLDMGA